MTRAMETTELSGVRAGSAPIAMLRITLGLIILYTWFDNVRNDLYTSDGISGFISWLFAEEGGNGSSLAFMETLLDGVVAANAGAFGAIQLVVEFLFGLSLLLGLFTRLGSLLACAFFATLFLAYFGGEEWIWTYVLLFMSSLTVFLGYGGRKLGVDQTLYARRGDSPAGLLW
ncbi:MAG: TQO small subunit DoxD [Actinomycetota bacterium]